MGPVENAPGELTLWPPSWPTDSRTILYLVPARQGGMLPHAFLRGVKEDGVLLPTSSQPHDCALDCPMRTLYFERRVMIAT